MQLHEKHMRRICGEYPTIGTGQNKVDVHGSMCMEVKEEFSDNLYIYACSDLRPFQKMMDSHHPVFMKVVRAFSATHAMRH